MERTYSTFEVKEQRAGLADSSLIEKKEGFPARYTFEAVQYPPFFSKVLVEVVAVLFVGTLTALVLFLLLFFLPWNHGIQKWHLARKLKN